MDYDSEINSLPELRKEKFMANAANLHIENYDLITKTQISDLSALHTRFLQEKTYLNNAAPKTIAFYESSFKAFNVTTLSQESLNDAIRRCVNLARVSVV